MKPRRHSIVVFKPSFLDIIVAGKGIEQAKKRVHLSHNGKYRYEPSEEYKALKSNRPSIKKH